MKSVLVCLFAVLAFHSARSEASDLKIWNSGFAKSFASPILISGRRSGNDPRLSYEGATKAYTDAVAPKFSELEGDWVLIGSAVSEKAISAGLRGFYAPEGKYESEGYPGYFQSLLSITADIDAFNKPILFGMLRVVGYETGKVYESEGPAEIIVGETEAISLLTGFTDASDSCLAERRCRVSSDSARLICRAILIDDRSVCKSLVGKQPYIYELLQRRED